MATKNFVVLSPDGFSIERENPIYGGIRAALAAFRKWSSGYKAQGHYSSVDYGSIDLLDLEDFCQFVEVDKEGNAIIHA